MEPVRSLLASILEIEGKACHSESLKQESNYRKSIRMYIYPKQKMKQ